MAINCRICGEPIAPDEPVLIYKTSAVGYSEGVALRSINNMLHERCRPEGGVVVNSPPSSMEPLQMIAEWRKGCSCAAAGRPEECPECTAALIDALEQALIARQRP